MATYHYEHQGVAYTVDTYESRGGWRWSVTVFDKIFDSKDRSLPVEALAINEAKGEAERTIDSVR